MLDVPKLKKKINCSSIEQFELNENGTKSIIHHRSI